jgi:hypothetical protein
VAGKYSGVVDDLPRFNGNEASYQDHVNQRKTELRAGQEFKETPVALAQDYQTLRAAESQLEAELKELRLTLEATAQMLVDQYEAEGTTSVRLMDGASVSVQVEPYAVVKDRDAHRAWAIANGLERLMALPWQTTNSITKERLLAGLPEPDGVESYAKTKLVLRKG